MLETAIKNQGRTIAIRMTAPMIFDRVAKNILKESKSPVSILMRRIEAVLTSQEVVNGIDVCAFNEVIEYRYRRTRFKVPFENLFMMRPRGFTSGEREDFMSDNQYTYSGLEERHRRVHDTSNSDLRAKSGGNFKRRHPNHTLCSSFDA